MWIINFLFHILLSSVCTILIFSLKNGKNGSEISIVLKNKNMLKIEYAVYCAVVKAYQYTSLTSVMLLDCWTIPSVIFLTWMFLKTRYRFRKFAGVGICVAGLVMVVFSDVHSKDRAGNDKSSIIVCYSNPH